MELSHVISDSVLAATSLYVFFRYLIKLDLSSTILWESFVLSVAGAAIFGAIRFAGFEQAGLASMFFQKIATITGSVGLIGASFSLASGIPLKRIFVYLLLSLGFVLFAVSEGFGFKAIAEFMPIMAMTVVVIMGVFALTKGNVKIGFWMIAGVIFFGLATYRHLIFGKGEMSIDVFHYLTAAGILSLGMAVSGSEN
ncbi:hypothetical protein [Lacihabitans lacunae]|uniref:Uncharacterized protein n=1 Tax=Lacihabitans lacunae TaxID=1028214 RepID=A0ABV7Z0K4_9BACT